jgi:hypothetical protein
MIQNIADSAPERTVNIRRVGYQAFRKCQLDLWTLEIRSEDSQGRAAISQPICFRSLEELCEFQARFLALNPRLVVNFTIRQPS